MSDNVSPLPSEPYFPDAFTRYIEQGQALAKNAGLPWNIKLDDKGIALKGCGWDLRQLLKDGNPLQAKLRTFSTFSKASTEMIARDLLQPGAREEPRPVSSAWQDFIKAYALNHLLVAGLSMPHLASMCNALRLIATVTNDKSPRHLNSDDISFCMSVAAAIQPSGQTVIVIRSLVKTVIDAYHLSDACPLYPLISHGQPVSSRNSRASMFNKRESSLQETLSSRKSAEK